MARFSGVVPVRCRCGAGRRGRVAPRRGRREYVLVGLSAASCGAHPGAALPDPGAVDAELAAAVAGEGVGGLQDLIDRLVVE